MFTGIIQDCAIVEKINKKEQNYTFTIHTNLNLKDRKIGDSIAINGACMTITKLQGQTFSFDCIKESLTLTNLKDLKIGSKINLELPLTLNQTIDGHLVQGHIDQMGTVKKFENNILEISFNQDISKYLAFKGSITINGVSLTISKLEEKSFQVSLVPHTIQSTNLKDLKANDKVNLEIDLIARYLDRLTQDQANQATYNFLKERNLL